MTAPFVADMLSERGLRVSDCDAVCLSMGPGSYTGLRVGSSTAKGLCFGGGIPLLAVGTLDVLAAQAIAAGLPEGCRYIMPMIDARRMEVYTATYSAAGERLTEVAPVVVESFGGLLGNVASRPLCFAERTIIPLHPQGTERRSSQTLCACGPLPLMEPRVATVSEETPEAPGNVLFIGDGVEKCREILSGEGRWFRQECPTAEAMLKPALEEFSAGRFRDTAYFEPFYLKDFVATVGKKLF